MRKTEIAMSSPFCGAPHFNCPALHGASPERPLLYRLPVTGARPLHFSAEGLPDGVSLDETAGILSGQVSVSGDYTIALCVRNALGCDKTELLLRIAGDAVLQTPLMGWCSWNAWLNRVTQDNIEDAAELLITTGLADYGYAYVNLDSAWQGAYGGDYDAIQPNERFPDMAGMCRRIHARGLKCGIYSTPFLNAFGLDDCQWGLPGCTRGEPDPRFSPGMGGIGIEHCERQNVRQWEAWGFDYLKYDWTPCEPENADHMKRELLRSGRDFGFCVTVHALPEYKDYWKSHCSSWRNNHDSADNWSTVCSIFDSIRIWCGDMSAGHFYDMDMLEIGTMQGKACRLTEDEQIFAYSFRAFFNSPIQLSCNLAELTDFERSVICNEEIIAVNQNIFRPGASCVSERQEGERHSALYIKQLDEHSCALGFFNPGETEESIDCPLEGEGNVRDCWAKRELGCMSAIKLTLAPHTARILKIAYRHG